MHIYIYKGLCNPRTANIKGHATQELQGYATSELQGVSVTMLNWKLSRARGTGHLRRTLEKEQNISNLALLWYERVPERWTNSKGRWSNRQRTKKQQRCQDRCQCQCQCHQVGKSLRTIHLKDSCKVQVKWFIPGGWITRTRHYMTSLHFKSEWQSPISKDAVAPLVLR